MTLTSEYLEAEKQIALVEAEHQSFIKAKNEEIHRQKWEVYEPKIRALIEERDKLIEKIRNEQIANEHLTKEKVFQLSPVIEKVNRILMFLRLKKVKDLTIKDEEVKAYRGRYIESLGYIFDDDFLKIKLFIMENSKPKNKYSLVAIGKCLFPYDLAKLPHGYDIPCHTTGWPELETVIRDLPTIEELKRFWDPHKQKQKILKQLLGNYRTIKKEYLETIKVHKIEDFKELIKYFCEKCGYFYTKNDIRRVRSSQETYQCGRCRQPMKLWSE